MAHGPNRNLSDDFAITSDLFLYIGNLDKKVTDKILYELFVKVGEHETSQSDLLLHFLIIILNAVCSIL